MMKFDSSAPVTPSPPPSPQRGRGSPSARGAPVCITTSSLLHVIAVAGQRIDDGDLLHREVRDDLDLVLVHDQHLLDTHAVAIALAVLGLEREGHALLDLDGMIERPDARDDR